jgi:hypothetical protein
MPRIESPGVSLEKSTHALLLGFLIWGVQDRVRCVDDDRPEFELRVEDSLSVLGLGFVGTQRSSEAAAGTVNGKASTSGGHGP